MKERVYRFRAVERELFTDPPGQRVLDLGCGPGDNLARLGRYGAVPIGVEPVLVRAREANGRAPCAAAVGEALPWRDGSFDAVYVSHVLHHARDLSAVLREAERVLRPGGRLFVIETVEDSPLLRLARWLQPSWDGDEVLNRFRFDELCAAVEAHDLRVQAGRRFNWAYFAWELVPLAFPPAEFLTPLAIAIERLLAPLGDRWGAHAWLSAQKPPCDAAPTSRQA